MGGDDSDPFDIDAGVTVGKKKKRTDGSGGSDDDDIDVDFDADVSFGSTKTRASKHASQVLDPDLSYSVDPAPEVETVVYVEDPTNSTDPSLSNSTTVDLAPGVHAAVAVGESQFTTK